MTNNIARILMMTILCTGFTGAAHAAELVELAASGSVAGDRLDESGLRGFLKDGTTPEARFGSWGSAIVYSGRDDIYYASPDGGPADGFRARVHTIRIAASGETELLKTTLLSGPLGRTPVGTPAAIKADSSEFRFDPEGIALRNGCWVLASEFGDILQFDTGTGAYAGRIGVPRKFLIPKARKSADKKHELKSSRGRQFGRGWEGLTVTPGGRIVVLLQNPLLQDHGLDRRFNRTGFCNRMLVVEPSGIRREYVYVLDSKDNGTNEILSIDETHFLVIERDSLAGDQAKYKRIHWIDLQNATDVSQVKRLPANPDKLGAVHPVGKKLFFDFLDPRWGIKASEIPEKIEGLAWGPDFSDGRRRLVVTTDNDFGVRSPGDRGEGPLPTQVFILSVDPRALAP